MSIVVHTVNTIRLSRHNITYITWST